jgi:hypothetical protein
MDWEMARSTTRGEVETGRGIPRAWMITGMALVAWMFVVAVGYGVISLFDLASGIL